MATGKLGFYKMIQLCAVAHAGQVKDKTAAKLLATVRFARELIDVGGVGAGNLNLKAFGFSRGAIALFDEGENDFIRIGCRIIVGGIAIFGRGGEIIVISQTNDVLEALVLLDLHFVNGIVMKMI